MGILNNFWMHNIIPTIILKAKFITNFGAKQLPCCLGYRKLDHGKGMAQEAPGTLYKRPAHNALEHYSLHLGTSENAA